MVPVWACREHVSVGSKSATSCAKSPLAQLAMGQLSSDPAAYSFPPAAAAAAEGGGRQGDLSSMSAASPKVESEASN